MNNIILMLCFLSINFLLSMDEKFFHQSKNGDDIQDENYIQTKSFATDEQDKVVNIFCIKNNIISAHESGILNIWDEDCRTKSKYFDLWDYLDSQKNDTNIIPRNSPGRVIQNTLYHNKIIYFVSSRTPAPSNIPPSNNLKKKSLQQVFILNIDNKQQHEKIGFLNQEISLIAPTGNFIITKSCVYGKYSIYDISDPKHISRINALSCALVDKDQSFSPKESCFQQYAFNKGKNSCALAIRSNMGSYQDIQLVILSTNDWAISRKNSIDADMIQSLAFNKDGSRLACLTGQNIYEIDTQKGTLLRTMPLIKSVICQINRGLPDDGQEHIEKKYSHKDSRLKTKIKEIYDFDTKKKIWTKNTIKAYYPIAIAYSNNEIVASNGKCVEEKVAYTENGLTKIKTENNIIFIYRKIINSPTNKNLTTL